MYKAKKMLKDKMLIGGIFIVSYCMFLTYFLLREYVTLSV